MTNAYQLGVLKNNYLYQGAYSEMDDDIGWNDFALRNYDPQIGRWVQQDPYSHYYLSSPYSGMSNDPINVVDPSGGVIESGLFQGATQFGKTAGMMVLGAIVGAVIDHASGGEGWTGAAIGAAFGGGASFSFTITAKVIQTANVANTIVNTSVISGQAGTAILGNQAYSGHGPNAGNLNDESGPDDYIYVDTKSKRIHITETDDPYDIVQIDDSKTVQREKGVTEKEYRDKGYETWHPKATGMGAVDDGIITLIGAKLGKFIFGRIASWWSGRVATKVLPRSGPIIRSLGGASRAEMLAKKLKLNINSPTTRQVLNSLDDTVESFINQFRKASIKSELPGEFLNQTVEGALKSGNTTVRKLLLDNRFVK